MHFFDREMLLNLFTADREARISQFERLLANAHAGSLNGQYQNIKGVHRLKGTFQAFKDESSITLVTFAALQTCGSQVLIDVLSKAFPENNWPVEKYKFELEKAITPTRDVLKSLHGEAQKHLVKYVRETSIKKEILEGATNYDAVISNRDGMNIFIEAKFTSDISVDTTHVTNRNQIARCIDVGLASLKDDVDRFFFIMLTPERYQLDPGDRLYYFKMKQYKENPQVIASDIPRFHDRFEDLDFLGRISKRIAFLSWETCADIILAQQKWNPQEREWLMKFYKDRLLH